MAPKPTVTVTAVFGTVVTTAWCWYYAWRTIATLRRDLKTERKLRFEERRGRTRAEVALRNTKKEALRRTTASSSSSSEGTTTTTLLMLKPIGVVTSCFPKRAGTPRQGALCPTSRGTFKLDRKSFRNVNAEALDGLDQYSHAWLVFEFHANTDDPARRLASKVQPPRGYGARVGWVATRSPHRANPIGLSLVRIAAVRASLLEIDLEGIDVCDGTPVFDLKPYVPWDAPPDQVRVPAWVGQDDALKTILWTPRAEADFTERASLLADFYDRDDPDDLARAKRAITDLLRHDPRSKRSRNAHRSSANANADADASSLKDAGNSRTVVGPTTFNVPFAGLEIYFAVDDATLTATVLELRPRRPATHAEDDLLCLSSV